MKLNKLSRTALLFFFQQWWSVSASWQYEEEQKDNTRPRRRELQASKGGGKKKSFSSPPPSSTPDPPPGMVPWTPCPDEFFTFDATMVAFLSKDPCEIGSATIREFLDTLIVEYNTAQREACDASFRSILDYSLPDICSHSTRLRYKRRELLGGFPLPYNLRLRSSRSRERRVTTTNRGRVLEENSSLFLPYGEDEPSVFHRSNMIQRALPPVDGICLCSENSTETTDGITEEQFESIANEVMLDVTDGEVEVLDMYQVTTGCAQENRGQFFATALMTLNVNVDTLSSSDISQLEEDCVLYYNSYIIEQCSAYYYQVRECNVSPFSPFVLQYDFYGDCGCSDNNAGRVFSEVGRRHLAIADVESHRALQTRTLPDDMCLCRIDVDNGFNPTIDEFIDFVDTMGIIVSGEVVRDGDPPTGCPSGGKKSRPGGKKSGSPSPGGSGSGDGGKRRSPSPGGSGSGEGGKRRSPSPGGSGSGDGGRRSGPGGSGSGGYYYGQGYYYGGHGGGPYHGGKKGGYYYGAGYYYGGYYGGHYDGGKKGGYYYGPDHYYGGPYAGGGCAYYPCPGIPCLTAIPIVVGVVPPQLPPPYSGKKGGGKKGGKKSGGGKKQ